MIIAGGCYYEMCRLPPSRILLGSGGRAALALKDLSPGSLFHTFFPAELREVAIETLSALGITARIHTSTAPIWFEYVHAMARPRIGPLPLPTAQSVSLEGDVVLGFGCLEGDFSLTGRRVVFDPQGGAIPPSLNHQAQELVLVLNKRELQDIGQSDDVSVAASRLLASNVSAIVVKNGPFGALVFDGGTTHVPAYCTRAVNKIGSGDVFSATFAHAWGEKNLSIVEAADFASRQSAEFVETNALPCPLTVARRTPIRSTEAPRVLVDGPTRAISDNLLANEVLQGLEALGVTLVRLPSSRPRADGAIARQIDSADVAFFCYPDQDEAVASALSIALSAGKPCVVLGSVATVDPRIVVEADLSTALYRAAWRGQND